MKKVLHITWIITVILLTVACSKFNNGTDAALDNTSVNLLLSINKTGEISDMQDIRTLRIIIVRPDGRVEHNSLYDMTLPGIGQTWSYLVHGEEQKRIYLIGNEDASYASPYSSIFKNVLPGDYFASGEAMRLTMDWPKMEIPAEQPLMLNAYYEVNVGKTDIAKDVYLMRSAVKVTYNIYNKSGRTITVEQHSFSPASHKEYYFSHRTEDLLNSNIEGPSWTVKGFTIPQGATTTESAELSWRTQMEGKANTNIEPGMSASIKPFYLFENILPQQKDYKIGITVDGISYNATITGGEAAITRNTHMIVNITYTDKRCQAHIDLIPYTGCILDPDFGI